MDMSISFLMSGTTLFKSLNHEEAEIVEKKLVVTNRKAGQMIYKEGEHAKSVCFVAEGELAVIKKDESGKEHQVATLKRGAAVGEMAVIDGIVRSASIKALTDVTIVIFKREGFDALLEEHPLIGIKLLKELARSLSLSLRKTSDELTKLSTTG
ncbi:MAG: cyclic nucleotide-binding domain-containing protein [Pseudomonadales bacterium]|nr:cyclic nucleotide-binding domain-containing protein [Pseudomonadales bacterium]